MVNYWPMEPFFDVLDRLLFRMAKKLGFIR